MNIIEDQSRVITFLSEAKNYPEPTTQVQQIETHGAIVFLTDTKAYKLKKSVYFPYMDYSTLSQRKLMCDREIFLNQRTAAEIYLQVLPVTQEDDNTLAFQGQGEAIEWLVEMNRFDPENVLDLVAARGELTPEIIDTLAIKIVDFHQKAEPSDRHFGAESLIKIIMGNDEQFATHKTILPRDRTQQLTDRSLTLIEQYRQLLDRRQKEGYIKHCHGDLHLHNICLYRDEPIFFDAIEFNELFSIIDVLYDLAFLLMDLDFRNFSTYANTIFNYYSWQENDYKGVALLPLFLATRAAVRAHVSVAIAEGLHDRAKRPIFLQEAAAYLEKSLAYLTPRTPKCVAIGGLSGTGKSTLAKAIAPQLDLCPGALILRSDVIRKLHFNIPLGDRLPESYYSKEVSKIVYHKLFAIARTALQAGITVIVDCVFADPNLRQEVEIVAKTGNIPFYGIWLDVPSEIAYQRIAERTQDVSDATVAIRQKQESLDFGEMQWQVFDASLEQVILLEQVKSYIS
ncbi:AAA family ATPase [Spirulina sp. 06S082]|uniref:bifunctional aminoglycoside phosphotransferase/ATP-binding protein n=1 Tax=Spirulina sp. 06S082 TaxID=3110248 RepID=UPI002B20B694|nr:AAA family ATPase [Spirulina sp. 06S082]MEA5469831.1 AAA family ATPase [Spirulina sp. 06S082]